VNLAARIAADITILGLLLAIFFSYLLLSTFYRQNNHLLLPAISGIPPGLVGAAAAALGCSLGRSFYPAVPGRSIPHGH
jgi:hypothetical protein